MWVLSRGRSSMKLRSSVNEWGEEQHSIAAMLISTQGQKGPCHYQGRRRNKSKQFIVDPCPKKEWKLPCSALGLHCHQIVIVSSSRPSFQYNGQLSISLDDIGHTIPAFLYSGRFLTSKNSLVIVHCVRTNTHCDLTGSPSSHRVYLGSLVP